MSDSEEELLLLLLARKRKRVNKNRRYWVHPYIKNNIKHSTMKKEFHQHPEKFRNFYRMNQNSFKVLLDLIKTRITKKDTSFRKAVPADEKLLILLRYLATGSSHTSLSYEFMRGRSTIGQIIAETTAAIWEVLQPIYMPTPTASTWIEKADRFYELYQLPNCIAALDGKHIRVKKPPKAGSAYFNYKSYNSVVLMAVSDADNLFISIDVGEAGRNSDGGVFRNSNLGRFLEHGQINLPAPRPLPNDSTGVSFPFYLVGDEAFPLKEYLIRPFPQRSITNTKRVFNYRISRGRKSVECAFGILTSKFRIMETSICCDMKTINNVIKAACVLHNFIRVREGIFAAVPSENEQIHANIETSIRNLVVPITDSVHSTQAQQKRNFLANYFIKTENALPWQWNYCLD